ncbi:hypothetical protein BJ508DRAFT_335999 [Ascobolus immersus RN42]|uniref:Uncharacterized protein n=1 Tax=Ascobolus immersus RN42 TaxID=1160509 RepID=A0A3N4HCP9_ASCIM|nr:hypothetical protein BJ508DRAFT_335999 [Ascobolus immersus RN42]
MLKPARGTGRQPVKPESTKPTTTKKTLSARIEASSKANTSNTSKTDMQITTSRPLVKLVGLKERLEDVLSSHGNVVNVKAYKYLADKALKQRDEGNYTLWMALSRSERYDKFLLGQYPHDSSPLSQGDRQRKILEVVKGMPVAGHGSERESRSYCGEALVASPGPWAMVKE